MLNKIKVVDFLEIILYILNIVLFVLFFIEFCFVLFVIGGVCGIIFIFRFMVVNISIYKCKRDKNCSCFISNFSVIVWIIYSLVEI